MPEKVAFATAIRSTPKADRPRWFGDELNWALDEVINAAPRGGQDGNGRSARNARFGGGRGGHGKGGGKGKEGKGKGKGKGNGGQGTSGGGGGTSSKAARWQQGVKGVENKGKGGKGKVLHGKSGGTGKGKGEAATSKSEGGRREVRDGGPRRPPDDFARRVAAALAADAA